MIARSWKARATAEGAKAYAAFFEAHLVPRLNRIDGHRGALVLTGPREGGGVEITVLTFWQSSEAVARFAGGDARRAVVEPEARAVLASFDDEVSHLEVALDTARPAEEAAPDTVPPDDEASDTVRPPDVAAAFGAAGREER